MTMTMKVKTAKPDSKHDETRLGIVAARPRHVAGEQLVNAYRCRRRPSKRTNASESGGDPPTKS